MEIVIWCIVTAALTLFGAGAAWYRQVTYRKRELTDISSMLECILDGREFSENRRHEETIYSKIQHQLYRLQSMTKGYHVRLEQDRDSIKNLITEIAHQLRTPLTNIESYLDFLGDTGISQQNREKYLQAVLVSEKKIHFLTENFIKMSRLEQRIIQIRPVDTDLLLTLDMAAGQVKRQAKERGVQIYTRFPKQLICAHDAAWLGEAVYNLLDNAVKYSQPAGQGKREILLGVEQNEMFVRIWVRDYGIGIAEGEEANVFQRFYRGKNTEKTEGFGLGLYLAREIVLLHQGVIRIARKNPGTCVEIFFSSC